MATTNLRACHHEHRDNLGGIIHTYQKFDPVNLPSPTAPPPDLVSPAFEHLLTYGSMRELTEKNWPGPCTWIRA